METQQLWSLFCALAIALAGSFLFLAAGYAWLAVGSRLQRRNPFAEHIKHEPGHRIRQSLENLDRRYYLCLAGLLVYVLLLLVAFALLEYQAAFKAPSGWETWTLVVVSIAAAGAALVLPYWVITLKRARNRLAFRRSANIAVGHALQKIANRGYNVYHDVRIGNHVIDNVVIGAKGAYAVNVFVLGKARKGNGTVRMNDSNLVFGNAKTSAPVGVSVNRVSGLSKALSRVIGHPIRVRSVIAVPGWNVASTDSDKHLLVNEKTVVMLTGWTDSESYLMDDDVAQIDTYLAARCTNGARTPP